MAFVIFGPVQLIAIIIGICQSGLAFRIEVNTEASNGLTINEINVTCIIEDPTYREIVVMEVAKQGQSPIAILRNFKLTSGVGMKTNMEIDGRIEKDHRKSFLRLTIKDPQIEDAGTYECLMVHLNEIGQLKEITAHYNVTVTDKDLVAAFMYLSKKVSALETTVIDQQDVISKQYNEIQSLNTTLKKQAKYLTEQQGLIKESMSRMTDQIVKQQDTKLRQLEKNMNDQENRSKLQQNSLTKFQKELGGHDKLLKNQKTRDGYMVAFSYGTYGNHDGSQSYKAGDTLIYDRPIMKTGNDYDAKTGVFTAPTKGFYCFHLSATSKAEASIAVDLMDNNGRSQATLYAIDKNYFAQSSISTVVFLKADDTIRPVLRTPIKKAAINGHHAYSVFTGYLLKLR